MKLQFILAFAKVKILNKSFWIRTTHVASVGDIRVAGGRCRLCFAARRTEWPGRPPDPNGARRTRIRSRRSSPPSTGSIRACAARRVRSSPPTIVGDGPTPPKSTDPPAVASSSFRVRKFVVVSERKFVVVRDDRPPTDRPRPRRPKPSSGRSGRFPRPTTRPEIVAADGAARRCHVRPRAPQ
jgi:hypothetical protein